MPNKRDLIDKASDAMEAIKEYTPIDVKRDTAAGMAMKTLKSLAVVAPLSLGVVASPTPVIQAQEPLKRQEEAVPSQSKDIELLEGANVFEEAFTSGSHIESGDYTDQVILYTTVKPDESSKEGESGAPTG